MYYNSLSSLEGLDEYTLGVSHVGTWGERHGDEIVMDLSYCVSSCGTTAWVLSWSCDGRVANLTYLILMEKTTRADGERNDEKVICLRYTQTRLHAMFSGVGAHPKRNQRI